MRFKNKSKYGDAEVRNLVVHATLGVNMSRVMVIVKNANNCTYRGTAYDGTPDCSPTSEMLTVDFLVTVGIGAETRFPADNMLRDWAWVDAEVDPHDVHGRYRVVDGITQRRSPIADRHPAGGKRCPYLVMNDWREGLVSVAAHEARHIYQFRNGKRRSEADAERFAAKRLVAYRLDERLSEEEADTLEAECFEAFRDPDEPLN